MALVLLMGPSESALAESASASPGPCRSLLYSIFWNGMPAGKAVLRCALSDDRAVVTLTGRTEALMDAVYPVTFEAESLLAADSLAARRYREKTREGRAKDKTELLVFGQDKIAGEDKIAVDVFKNGRLRRTLPVPLGTLDPLGALYRFLGDSGNRNPFLVTDGRRVFEVHMMPGRREEVATPSGRRSVQVWDAAVKVISGKPHVLEKASIRVWTSADDPFTMWKAAVALPYGVFSTQKVDEEL
uniref:DUF3108 domain-containing protein n=1 Tax=Desulfacinum infernum TaxID=35837 RepID=A0A832A283_9BACT